MITVKGSERVNSIIRLILRAFTLTEMQYRTWLIKTNQTDYEIKPWIRSLKKEGVGL